MVLIRDEVALEDRWNIEALYTSMEAWDKAYAKISREGQQPRWPEILVYKGRLQESPEILKSVLDLIFSLDRVLSSLYTYAHLRHDENLSDDKNKSAFSRISNLVFEFNQTISWIDPEILSLSEETIHQYLQSPTMAMYRFYLEKLMRLKRHTLSEREEEIIALSERALQAPHKAFAAINDADFSFGQVHDSLGKEHLLTHGQFGLHIRGHDPVLRENAFKQYHNKYRDFENTLCEMLSGQINKNLFHTKARNYGSCLEAALYPHQINPSVYRSLIRAVHEGLGSLHKYLRLRKKIQKVDTLHLFDLYVPLTKHIDISLPYAEAEEVVIESVAPLGKEYQEILKDGLKKHRWVDRYENRNKRSGAYSSGCYDSMPYILMNYKGVLRDVITLAHEAGHSMHSLLSRRTQPYHYAQYPIFLAEVASTFNEELLIQSLLKRFTGREEKIFLINQKIEDIRATLFRQTLFAEFELAIHELTEQGVPLTPGLLKEKYRALNEKYYGPEVIIDKESDIEWARIPHFYYNFYVYQYATGVSAALSLFEKVSQGRPEDRDAYLTFLKSGGSRYPIDLLKATGVDMQTPQPVSKAIAKFDNLVDQLSSLLSN